MNLPLDEINERLAGLSEAQKKRVVADAIKATKAMRWVPNPGPQTLAYNSDADELFYGGQAGGGKSDLGIGLALNKHTKSLIIREYNEDARSLGGRLMEILGSQDGWNGQILRYQDKNVTIEFGGCKAEEDKQRYKGDPHDLIVFDEVGDFTQTQYTFICAWNRSTKKGQKSRVVATGNPPTRAKGLWVIERWAAWLNPNHPNPAQDGEIRWYLIDEDSREIEVDGPGPHQVGREMIRARSRSFIRAKLSDNPDLAATDYDANLAALPPELRMAYREGRFDMSLKDAVNQVIPTDWVRQAQQRWSKQRPKDVPQCVMGVDMSGGGTDPMIIASRYDGWYDELVEIPGKSLPMESLGRTAAGHVIANRRNNSLVVVDMGGGYGGSLYEHLKDNLIPVSAYKGAEACAKRSRDGKLRFTNKRSAAYWLFREALDPGQNGGSPIMLPDDPKLVADLTTPTFEMGANGIKVEPKDILISRLGRSPDRGDAVVMAWFEGAKQSNSALEWIEKKINNLPRVVMGRHHAR